MQSISLVSSRPEIQQWVGRYATAILTTGLAIWGRFMLHPWLGNQCEFSLFYLSVLATAWIAGTGPAVFAILLGSLSAAHFFIEPATSLAIEQVPDLVQFVIFFLVNIVATTLFSRLHRQKVVAEDRSDENLRLSESLRIADERKDEFLALLAHELRNPLAPIRTSLALLERKADSPDAIRRIRDVILRQTNHLVRITDDLLDVSRFSHGKITLDQCPVNLCDVVHDAVEMVQELIDHKRHSLQLLLPSSPSVVIGDRVRLTQMISNLLGNAAKYTPENGRIAIEMEREGDQVSVSVVDNGIGFSPSEAEKILAPFAQVDGSRTRQYGGLGVGLTIVNRLVALHQGTFHMLSRGPGRGSRFTVTLPALSAACTEQHGCVESVDQSSVSPEGGLSILEDSIGHSDSHSLLLVEDSTDASTILKELFEAEGYVVEVKTNGIDALATFAGRRYETVILDIGLPGMDGFEIAQRMRRQQGAHRPFLIALTGWGSPADQQLAIESGFDLHLVKPIVFADLLQRVRAGYRGVRETRQEDCAAV